MACSGCGGRTATGGRAMAIAPTGTGTYQVTVNHEVLAEFTSAIAAATYARGIPRAVIHRLPT